MSMQLAPTRMSLPPPRLTLVDAQRAVGWISNHAFGFSGFSDEFEAANAAWVAYRTVFRRLARSWGTRSIPIDVEPLTLARVGNHDMIIAGRRPVALLLRPAVKSPSGRDSFGFEIAISPSIAESMLRDLTKLAYRALRKSGIRWALWRQQPTPETTIQPRGAEVSSDDGTEAIPSLGKPGSRHLSVAPMRRIAASSAYG